VNAQLQDALAVRTPFERLGGEEAVRRLVNRFYDLMESAPEARELRAMHASDLAPMRDKLSDFLIGWLGGPPRYLARSDRKCLTSAHSPYAIGAAERDQWLVCMQRALVDVGADEETRRMLEQPLSRVAEALRNR
jgi:hemoglobin